MTMNSEMFCAAEATHIFFYALMVKPSLEMTIFVHFSLPSFETTTFALLYFYM